MFNECRRIKDDGQRCHAAALEGKPYCFFHMKFDRMYCRDRIEIPPIEDSTSVLLAIGQVVRALNFETMDCRRAGLMLYGLQIASSVTARREQAKPVDSVRSVHNLAGEPLEFSEAFVMGAPMLAPENSVCEPPHDCASCPQIDSCEKRQALLQSTHAEDPDDEPVNNPEDVARRVREELYAITVRGQKAHPELHHNPLPPLEEFHRYLTIDAADAESPGGRRENSPARNAGINAMFLARRPGGSPETCRQPSKRTEGRI